MLCMALATRKGRTFSRLGFVQSLELLFAQQFSRPGKRLENGDEVWTNNLFAAHLKKALFLPF